MPGFNPYLTTQQSSAQEAALQQQIGYLQSQLQQVQSARQQMMAQQQAIQQIPQQTQPGIMTQIVESFDTIAANAVPMDNYGAVFIKNDGSEIQTRRWTNDGRIQMTSYLPQQAIQNQQANNLSSETEKLKFDLSDDATEAFMQRFDDIVARLEKLEQNFTPKSRSKKEVDSE